jgi:hypothetical protein
MERLIETIPRDRFLSLPRADRKEGGARRVGVEIEFAGMTETAAAAIVAEALGGRVVDVAEYELAIEDSDLGRIDCYLDTAFRKGRQHALSRLGLEIGREVIPVELVTEPLAPGMLPALEDLRERLRSAGALGSRDGVFLSFGVHLNVEVVSPDVTDWRPVLAAFALIEDWLRLADPIDGSRRLLPFVDPYPTSFVRGLLDMPAVADARDVIRLYLEENPTRNRALDMLPLFARIAPEEIERQRSRLGKIAPRPTYHYRLPDSRIDEPAWRLAYEWNRWVLVERVAADAGIMARLADSWRASRWTLRSDWCGEVETILEGAGLGATDAGTAA